MPEVSVCLPDDLSQHALAAGAGTVGLRAGSSRPGAFPARTAVCWVLS